MAAIFAIRIGLADARAGRPLYQLGRDRSRALKPGAGTGTVEPNVVVDGSGGSGSTTSACGVCTWIDREQNPDGKMVSFPTARTRQP